jgi:hippurate hydrolase
MPVHPEISAFADDLTAIRRDFHAHPEIGFQETRTAAKVAEMLESWGVETHRGVGKTGVVGVLEGKGTGKSIGLRADMDALPIQEETNLEFRSQTPGVMHACGHDCHTTMLLGAARYLSENRDFSGRAVFIFQPAEEGLGGARAMLADKLFEQFPCDEIYGMHNNPNGRPNQVGVKPGVAMAGADFFDIRIRGAGSHAAHPHESRDPILVASTLINALQSVVSRNADPTQPLVLSVTQVHAGSAYNVIPATAEIAGTIRFFDHALIQMTRQRVRELAAGMAASFGVEIDVEIREIFEVLENDPDLAHAMIDIAGEVVGTENSTESTTARTGSEDFADMLRAVPGAYCTLGHAGTMPLHSPQFVLDESILPVGAAIYARLVERRTGA